MTPDKIEITDTRGGFNVRLIGSKTIEGYESTVAGLLATISVQAEKMKSEAAPEALLVEALGEVRQFVKLPDGRVGVVIGNDRSGGVLRGHCDMWFGTSDRDSVPIVKQCLVTDEWVVVPAPTGIRDE